MRYACRRDTQVVTPKGIQRGAWGLDGDVGPQGHSGALPYIHKQPQLLNMLLPPAFRAVPSTGMQRFSMAFRPSHRIRCRSVLALSRGLPCNTCTVAVIHCHENLVLNPGLHTNNYHVSNKRVMQLCSWAKVWATIPSYR